MGIVTTFGFVFNFYFLLRFGYLYRKREYKQGEQQREREKQALHWAGSLMWGSIPGPWDYDPRRGETLNRLSGPGATNLYIVLTVDLSINT